MGVTLVFMLILPALILWLWLLEEAIRTSIQCPSECWCDPGRRTADCSNASLKDIPQSFHDDIRDLRLDHNDISVLKENVFRSAGLHLLEILNVYHSGLVMMEPGAFRGLPRLEQLHLHNNMIRALQPGTFANMTNLLGLHLANNRIQTLQPGLFTDLINLNYISLESNFIQLLHADVFLGLTRLRNLWLSENEIVYLHPVTFKHMKKLRLICLENNTNLEVPAVKPFLDIPTLENLILSNCNIKNLSAKTFQKTRNLTTLYLHGNNLKTFDMDIPKVLPYLSTLYLYKNPLQCDCELLRLWQWCRNHKVKTGIEHDVPRCEGPEQVSGLWWGVLGQAQCKCNRVEFFGDYKTTVDEIADRNDELEKHWNFLKYGQTSVYAILFLIGTIGNTTVIIIIVCNKRMRTVSYVYILNLAVGDLFSLTMNLPLYQAMVLSEYWVLGEFLCKLAVFFRPLSIGVSGFSVTILSVQRYFATLGSLRLSTRLTTIMIILAVWVIAICCALPSAFSVRVDHNMICTSDYVDYYRMVDLFHLLAFCAMPLCVIVTMHVMTARQLIMNARRMQGDAKTCKTLAKVVLGLATVFFISFVPYHVLWTVILWEIVPIGLETTYVVFASSCLLVLNSCFNPISLYCTSVTFRRQFERYFLALCRRAKTRLKDEEESDLPAEEPSYKDIPVRYQRRSTSEIILF
jgi:Leucine-rich repeat (LRR) protein